jgi:hypothetical protein
MLLRDEVFSCVPRLRAGLFYGLSVGEFCPLPLFPSATLGARGLPHG